MNQAQTLKIGKSDIGVTFVVTIQGAAQPYTSGGKYPDQRFNYPVMHNGVSKWLDASKALNNYLVGFQVGDTVEITFVQDGQKFGYNVTKPGTAPPAAPPPPANTAPPPPPPPPADRNYQDDPNLPWEPPPGGPIPPQNAQAEKPSDDTWYKKALEIAFEHAQKVAMESFKVVMPPDYDPKLGWTDQLQNELNRRTQLIYDPVALFIKGHYGK